jgi:hypothetical protein
MSFRDAYLVSENLATVTLHEIEQVEQQMNLSFPCGYAEYMTTLGVGTYCGYVRVYPPAKILHESHEIQERWNTYYFWDAGWEVLEKEQVVESIPLADTGNGDELIFHPSRKDKLYVLPHSDEVIYNVGPDLDTALIWLCEAGITTAPLPFRYFESWCDRARIVLSQESNGPSFLELRQQILSRFQQLSQRIDESDGGIEVFMKGFWGSLSIFGFPNGNIQAAVVYDINKNNQLLNDVVQFLQSTGFSIFKQEHITDTGDVGVGEG